MTHALLDSQYLIGVHHTLMVGHGLFVEMTNGGHVGVTDMNVVFSSHGVAVMVHGTVLSDEVVLVGGLGISVSEVVGITVVLDVFGGSDVVRTFSRGTVRGHSRVMGSHGGRDSRSGSGMEVLGVDSSGGGMVDDLSSVNGGSGVGSGDRLVVSLDESDLTERIGLVVNSNSLVRRHVVILVAGGGADLGGDGVEVGDGNLLDGDMGSSTLSVDLVQLSADGAVLSLRLALVESLHESIGSSLVSTGEGLLVLGVIDDDVVVSLDSESEFLDSGGEGGILALVSLISLLGLAVLELGVEGLLLAGVLRNVGLVQLLVSGPVLSALLGVELDGESLMLDVLGDLSVLSLEAGVLRLAGASEDLGVQTGFELSVLIESSLILLDVSVEVEHLVQVRGDRKTVRLDVLNDGSVLDDEDLVLLLSLAGLDLGEESGFLLGVASGLSGDGRLARGPADLALLGVDGDIELHGSDLSDESHVLTLEADILGLSGGGSQLTEKSSLSTSEAGDASLDSLDVGGEVDDFVGVGLDLESVGLDVNVEESVLFRKLGESGLVSARSDSGDEVGLSLGVGADLFIVHGHVLGELNNFIEMELNLEVVTSDVLDELLVLSVVSVVLGSVGGTSKLDEKLLFSLDVDGGLLGDIESGGDGGSHGVAGRGDQSLVGDRSL